MEGLQCCDGRVSNAAMLDWLWTSVIGGAGPLSLMILPPVVGFGFGTGAVIGGIVSSGKNSVVGPVVVALAALAGSVACGLAAGLLLSVISR